MNKRMIMCVGVAVTVFFTAPTCHSQSTELWQRFKEKFPDEPAVFVERSEAVSITIKGDSLEVYEDVMEDVLHLKDQTDRYSNSRVYGSHFNQVASIKAKTLVWDKSRYREVAVSDFKRNSSDRNEGIFYDDSYYYSFSFPSVSSRNRTQLEYRTKVKDAKFLSGYVFPSYLAQGKTSFSIKAPKEVDIYYEVLNDKQSQVRFHKYEKAGFIYYEWSATDLPPFKIDENSPPIRYYAPHVICYIKSYQTSNGSKTVLSKLNDLYQWYYSFIESLNQESSSELVSVVEDIKGSSSGEEEIVKKVFYWVQENIHYIAFEDGMRGLIPHSGSYVCEKRYGDCKDMANLIINMLKLAGIKAYHTWIGTRDLPYQYTKLPTPLVDNHMIATYISHNKRYYFLDATSNHTAFGIPSSMIQGKEALIGIDKGLYEIRTVPTLTREQNIVTDSAKIKLDGNNIAGVGTSSLYGYARIFGAYRLDRSKEDDVKKYVADLTGKGSNKFFLDSYEVSNLAEREKPLKVNYTFRIGDYFQKIGDEIYINLNLNKHFYNAFINTQIRKTPQENEFNYLKRDVYELAIPDGYEPSYMPPNARHDGQLMGYDIRYEVKGGKIIYTKDLYVNYLLMHPEQFANWNESVKMVSDAYKESIIFKKK